MQAQNIDIKLLQPNTGQIEGLPKNPRLIKDDRFKQLVQSIQDDPEMLDLRECIVYPQNGHFVIIAGNMRLQACKKLKFNEVPCKVLSSGTPINKLKAYTIKDNIPYGENDWEMLANEWDQEELVMWGMELPVSATMEGEDNEGAAPISKADAKKSLSERFIIPPFSVFDTKQGYWQERKRHWLALGLKSELGRGGGILMAAKEITTENLNYYRNRQEQH